MKRITVLFVLFFIAATAVFAQPRDGQRNMDPEEMAKRQTAELKEVLDLSAGQEKKVYEINLETIKKMRKLRQEMQGSGFDAMREKMGEIRTAQDKKMKDVLTDRQWEKYQKHLEERREQRSQRRGNWR